MIVDSHCHILPPDFASRHDELTDRDATYAALFPDSGGRFADAVQLLRDMDVSGVNHAVAMGFGWTDPDIAAQVNDYLIQSSLAQPDRITAFASVNPAWGEAAVCEASRCLDAGAVGIGELHADSQGFDIGDPTVMSPLMTLLRARNAPIVVHASEPVGHQYPGKGSSTPDLLLQLAKNFPANRIVFAHLGGGLPFYAAMPEVADALKNVWYDTAALPYLYRPSAIAAAATIAGADRVLFGTDYPLLKHRRVIDHVRSAGLPQSDTDAIMGANACSLVNPGDQPMETLPDYLEPGLDIVLIGLNPSTRSVRAGHYFANPRNRFWSALTAANFVGRPVGPGDDASLLADGIGFTDVVKRPTSQASGLTAADYRRDAPTLREKLLSHVPRIACFHGLTAYRAYLRHGEGIKNAGNLQLGRQDLLIGSSRVFVLPNPSPANARYSLNDLAFWYLELNRWRAELAS
ncbi:MAG: amidohydrolase family protein [Chloroflexi bacterium]|nr:amidohydrolase family protein [Chloroflexota bacterium]